MKPLPLIYLALAAAAMAEVPKPVPVTRYAGLWTNSPFTTKPPEPTAAEAPNPLEDYALGGIAPITGGYRVTLLNRKNPEERIVLPDNQEFKILAVEYAQGNPLQTIVRLATGSKTGTVSFDEKLLMLKAAPAAAPQQQQQQLQNPPGVPGQPAPTAPAEGQRAPRPRVVPPAAAQGGAPGPGVNVPHQQQQQQQRTNQAQGQQRVPRR